MMNLLDGLSAFEELRFFISIAFTVGLFAFLFLSAILMTRNARNIRALLLHAEFDRDARHEVLESLHRTADALAVRTQAVVDANDQSLRDISQRLIENTEMTKRAADASAEAAHVANSVNEKIAETNQRLLETTKAIAKKDKRL